MCWRISNLTTDLLESEHFPQSNIAADNAVKKSRRRQIQDGPISSEPSIDDFLLSLRTRINPLRVLGIDLFSAAIHAHDVLWPGEEPLKGVAELIAKLRDTESKLRAWRHSSARARSDEALAWALSWYEGMNLNLLEKTREGSLWLSDPQRIQRRQARAYEIAKYAETRAYIDGDDNSDAEDDEGDEEGDDAGASGSEADAHEEEQVDEHIQIDRLEPTMVQTTLEEAVHPCNIPAFREPRREDLRLCASAFMHS